MSIKNVLVVLVVLISLFNFVSAEKISEDVMDAFNTNNEVRVIVKLDDNYGRLSFSISDIYEKIQIRNIERISERENYFSAIISQDEISLLEQNDFIDKVYLDIPIQAFLQDSTTIVNASSSWPAFISGYNLTGKGQSVCVLDTGIDKDNSNFAGRIVAEYCYCTVTDAGSGGCCPDSTGEDINASDDYGHGTHVSGIVGASGGITGVAPEANLVIVKIMDSSGNGVSSDLDNGIDWCINNAETYNISVITMSLGATTKRIEYCDGLSETTTDLINNATGNGISVTIATGNQGWTDGITWPSCIENATRVGAVDKSDGLLYNRNNLTNLTAPGLNINSTWYDGTYYSDSGTSMAAPHVAGAIALIKQLLNLTGTIKTPKEIENILYDTGFGIAEGDNNFSRINVYDALVSLDELSPNVSLVYPTNSSSSTVVNNTFTCNSSDLRLANATLFVWNSSNDLINETTMEIEGTFNETDFDLYDLDYGDYEWNCLLSDFNGNFALAENNFSITIINFAVRLISPENELKTNQNQTFKCNVSSENEFSNITLYVWNSSEEVYTNFTEINGTENETTFIYDFENDDNYEWNCLAKDSSGREAFSSSNYSVIYDVTSPSVSLISPENEYSDTTETTIGFRFSFSDKSNVTSCSLVINGSSDSVNYNSSDLVSGTNTIQKTVSTGTYYWIINCSDELGNSGVSETRTLIINSAPVLQTTGGGGGGSTYTTYVLNEEQSSKGDTKTLEKEDKIKFKISQENKEHTITLTNISLVSATILIQSSPILVNLNIGQEIKLNISSPDYYNLYVKLESIVSGKAKLTIKVINELIPNQETEEIPIEEEINNTSIEVNETEVYVPTIKEHLNPFLPVIFGILFLSLTIFYILKSSLDKTLKKELIQKLKKDEKPKAKTQSKG